MVGVRRNSVNTSSYSSLSGRDGNVSPGDTKKAIVDTQVWRSTAKRFSIRGNGQYPMAGTRTTRALYRGNEILRGWHRTANNWILLKWRHCPEVDCGLCGGKLKDTFPLHFTKHQLMTSSSFPINARRLQSVTGKEGSDAKWVVQITITLPFTVLQCGC